MALPANEDEPTAHVSRDECIDARTHTQWHLTGGSSQCCVRGSICFPDIFFRAWLQRGLGCYVRSSGDFGNTVSLQDVASPVNSQNSLREATARCTHSGSREAKHAGDTSEKWSGRSPICFVPKILGSPRPHGPLVPLLVPWSRCWSLGPFGWLRWKTSKQAKETDPWVAGDPSNVPKRN